MKRRIIIAGNWKMHMSAAETRAFVEQLLPQVKGVSSSVYLAPPFTSIQTATDAALGSAVCIGAQNMSQYHKGAYTGEVSSMMLKEAGASFVILGHSERRHIFKEDNEMIHSKLKWALEEKIEPILCIGETQEEQDQNRTKEVLEAQLGEALKDFSPEEVRKMILAYEPVWAIGTGKTATPEIAQEAHLLCRSFVAEKCGKEAAEVVPILYGGSVKPENIGELVQKPDIDGALIGGASLEVDSFAQIIHNVEETLK